MSGHYQKVLDLLKKWPIDKSKGTQDFGLHLRERAKSAFPVGSLYGPDEPDKKHAALMRLSDNRYAAKFLQQQKISATGLTAQQCNEALSTEFRKKFCRSANK